MSVAVPIKIAYSIDAEIVYGIKADGVTDNKNALMRMRRDLEGYGKPVVEVIMPEGTILTSDNRWGFNILNMKIKGAGKGCTFRSIYTGSDEKFWRPFWQGELWQTNTLSYIGTITYTTNYKFTDVTAGSTTMTVSPSDATAIAALITNNKNRILIWADDQVGNGFPPGTRKNEWNRIVSINTGTGVITLRRALKNSYSTSVHDVPDIVGTGSAGGSGLPRITLLDRADFIYPEYIEFENVTFGNPVDGSLVIRPTASGTFQAIGNRVITRNCLVEGHFWPSQSEFQYHQFTKVIADPANFASEFDKVVGTVICEDCYFRNSVSNATGIETVKFDRCHFDESVQLCPRYLSIKNCFIRGNFYPDNNYTVPLYGAPAANPIRLLEIQNLTFGITSTNLGAYAMEIKAMQSLTLTAVSANDILIPYTGYMSTDAVKFYTIESGYTEMFKDDGTKLGVVTSRTWNASYNSGQGAMVISGNWNVAPVVGEVWKWSNYHTINDLGGHKFLGQFNANYPMYGDNMILRLSNGEKGKVVLNEKCFDYTGGDHVLDVYGQFVEFDVRVRKGYNGSDSACKLYIITDPSGNDICTINLKTAGRRTVTQFAANGSLTGDALDITKLGIWHKKIHIFIRGSSGNLSDQTQAAMPIFDIIIKRI